MQDNQRGQKSMRTQFAIIITCPLLFPDPNAPGCQNECQSAPNMRSNSSIAQLKDKNSLPGFNIIMLTNVAKSQW